MPGPGGENILNTFSLYLIIPLLRRSYKGTNKIHGLHSLKQEEPNELRFGHLACETGKCSVVELTQYPTEFVYKALYTNRNRFSF